MRLLICDPVALRSPHRKLDGEKMILRLRPAILPDDTRLFFYPVIIGLVISAVGLFLGNIIVVILPLIVLAVFPGLPVLFHLIYHLLVYIDVWRDRIVVTDYVKDRFVRFKARQEISFAEIRYVYYLGREINLLLNLRNRLGKFKIAAKETDYRRDSLISRYGIPGDLYEEFEKSSQKTLTDYTATGVWMKLDEICHKYDVSKETRDRIKEALKNDSNYSFDYLKNALRGCSVDMQDFDGLKDELTHIDVDVLAPFLLTQVNLGRYQKAERQRGGAHVTARTDNGLVLSNEDGTKKIYLMHFHDLSERDVHRFINRVTSKQPDISFLMTRKERERLLS